MNGRSNQNARRPKEEWSKWEGSRFCPDFQSERPGARSAARRYARAVAGVVAGHCLPLVRSAQARQPESGAGTHPALLAAACEGTLLQRSEEHTSELQSRLHLVCRLLLEKKKTLR